MASAAASTTATAPSSTSPKAAKVEAAPLSKLYDAALEAEYLKRCIGYSKLCLQCLPEQYDRLDTNRMTAVYFSVASLDVLGHLESSVDKQQIIDWVYAQQVLPDSDSPDKYLAHCGFQGGTFLGKPYGVEPDKYKGGPYDTGNIAMTYTALCTLIMLGDDLSKVNRKAVAAGLAALQQPNGSFCAVVSGSEADTRFVYCACAISYMINDWSGVDVDKAAAFVKRCQRYEGGFALLEGQEAHGGSTYCSLAALKLMGKLDEVSHREDLLRWCMFRQIQGFNGRTNKLEDSCYSFWLGGSLRLLGHDDLINRPALVSFLATCKSAYGAYCKAPDSGYPDVLHAYYSICGLSLVQHPMLQQLDVSLAITARAAKHCEKLRATTLEASSSSGSS